MPFFQPHCGIAVRAAATSPWRVGRVRYSRDAKEVAELAEVRQRELFRAQLAAGSCAPHPAASQLAVSAPELATLMDAGFATFLLHVEARIASLLGQGFYTIGPCGEEMLSAVGLALRPDDGVALHYRHLAVQLARQLTTGRSIEEVLLDRARGFTCSARDPVTGGVHCSLGGGPHDFIVTSTLASQAPQAVGRALAAPLVERALRGGETGGGGKRAGGRAVQLVSCGDGSVNNGHMLSALNQAQYSHHRGFKVRVRRVDREDGRAGCMARAHAYLGP